MKSIDEIQRELEETQENIDNIAIATQRTEQGLEYLNKQEQDIVKLALTPTQLENKKILQDVKGSLNSMERRIGESAHNMDCAYDNLSSLDIDSMNIATTEITKLLQLSDPIKRTELIEALEFSYQEKNRMLEESYKIKKEDLAELEKKYRNLKIKMIARNVLIAVIILLILAFAIRWCTLLANQISSIEQKNEQVGQISAETEKADTDKNRGFLEWLLPADEELY